jgi:hypothetical protein
METNTTTTEQEEQLTNLEAATLLALMQDAVDSVPSYVETRAIEAWIENSLEQ